MFAYENYKAIPFYWPQKLCAKSAGH